MGYIVKIDGDDVIVPQKALLALQYIIRQMGTNDAIQYLWDILDGTLKEEAVEHYFKEYQDYFSKSKCYRCYVKCIEHSSVDIHTQLGFEVNTKSKETLFSTIGEVSAWLAKTVSIAQKFKCKPDIEDMAFENRNLLGDYIHKNEYIEIPLFGNEGIKYKIIIEEM